MGSIERAWAKGMSRRHALLSLGAAFTAPSVLRAQLDPRPLSEHRRFSGLHEMNWKFAVCVLASVGVLTAFDLSASAHHGGGVEWQNRVEGPIVGVATKFAFRFPHVVLFIDVEDESGNAQQWALNTRWTPTILRGHGWTRNSIKPGDTIAVTYRPHVTQPAVVNMVTLEVNGTELPLQF